MELKSIGFRHTDRNVSSWFELRLPKLWAPQDQIPPKEVVRRSQGTFTEMRREKTL